MSTMRPGLRVGLKLFAALIGVFVVATAVTVPSFIGRYRPLRAGNPFGPPAGATAASAQDGSRIYRIAYADGNMVSARLAIANGGRFAVQVTGLVPDEGHWLLSQISMQAEDCPTCKEVRIAPHTQSIFILILRMGDCENYENGTSTTMVSTQVRYRFAGTTKTQWIDLPAGLLVDSPTDQRCPRSRKALRNHGPAVPTPSPAHRR